MNNANRAGATVIKGFRSVVTFARFVKDPLSCMARLYEDGGGIVRIHVPFSGHPGRETVLLTEPKPISRVLMRPDEFRTSGVAIHGTPGSAQKRLRHGIVRANGAEHRKLRQAYAGFFERDTFLDLPTRILPLVRDEVASWPSDRFTDLPPLASRLIRRMAIATLFPGGDESESLRIAAMIEAHARAGFRKRVLAFPFDIPLTPYRRLLAQAKDVERAIMAWADRYPRGGDRPNLMDTIHDVVGARRGAACTRVAAQIWTLLGASFDTSATTLTWTLYLLAQHPDWAARVHAAVSDVLGQPHPDAGALLDLDTLEHVVRESMRVLTPVPYQRRISLQDVRLGDEQFARNTTFILSAFMTNRLKETYPDPAVFRPDRWETIDPSAFQHLTFSAGPRRCLGYWMALGMLKTALSVILFERRPELKPDQRVGTTVAVTLRPSSKLSFRFPRHDGKPGRSVRMRGRLARIVSVSSL